MNSPCGACAGCFREEYAFQPALLRAEAKNHDQVKWRASEKPGK